MRVLLVQNGGDYREAVERFSTGGEETYYAQRYSVNTIADIGKRVDEMIMLICNTDEPYDEVLQNGVHGIGAGFREKILDKQLISLIEKQNPTHLIVTTPIRSVLSWAIQNKVRTVVMFADSFPISGIRNKIRNYQLARFLNHPLIEWVGNHNINSAQSLQSIGVNPDKIIPWDWPAVVTPNAFATKLLQKTSHTWNLIYVGSISEEKGVGDILEAVSKLRSRNFLIGVQLAGGGDISSFEDRAKKLDIVTCVNFLGLVPNTKIVHLMHEADIVIIPSRHEYPEGLPMTIYEALCSRSPIIVSDHPMFRGKLQNNQSAVVFPAGDSEALAGSIERLLSDADLYQQLSENSAEAWKRLQIPVKFGDFLNHWLFDAPQTDFLYGYRLSSGRYK